MTTVGVYEAKTQLPHLLDQVLRGERVTITRHGKAVAMLIPVAPGAQPVADVITSLRAFRRGHRLGRASLRSLIIQGRR